MIFQVLSPIVASIDGDSFKDAIKTYIKLNHNINLNRLIISDQQQTVQANLKYYQQDGRNKVGIDMYPVTNVGVPLITSPGSYLPPRVIEVDSDQVKPVLAVPFPVSVGNTIPMANNAPFIPTVIKITNN